MPMNKKHIINERRHKVAELYLKGWPQFKIAEITGVTQAQVSFDLKHLSKQWQASAMIDIDKIKARELAKLNRLEREYCEGWEKSKEFQIREKRKYRDAQLEEVNKETIETCGDPRFLDGILKCIAKREEILGYGPPSKKAIDVDLKMERTIDTLSEGTLDLILNRIIQQNYESYPEATTDKGSAGWPEEG